MAKVTLRQLEQLLLDAAELLGKMDVTAKRNYVFALLLLKRCSDAFDEARETVYAEELSRTGSERAAEELADDPDEYTTHVFVPAVSRWTGLVTQTNRLGNRLNDALKGLEEFNTDLAGSLSHIDFNKAPGGERPDDATLVALVRMLSDVRLRDEDLEFPDLIGAVYESVLRQFADQTGSSSGDLYTPRPVVRLMVGLAAPRPRDMVYDPCAGSAGMLVLAREYVADHHPGQGGTVALAGQDVSAAQWVGARMNLLLHGIRDADVQLGDTLAEPRHIAEGRPQRFTRILSNPEFSAEYDPVAVAANAYGRFRYGVSGKAADLMFVQHMVASLADGGLAVTVMPHGVLFRGGKERAIREGLLRADVIEAVIGLGPGIFAGTGIPACLLLLRAPGGKEAKTRGSVLFINADREYTPGRTQNHLGEEHIEKIARVYREWRTVDRFSCSVPVTDLLADANLNIRRWVDNTPPPEPQDVGAHLYGGVPRTELAAAAPEFGSFALDINDFFVPLDGDYVTFLPEGPEATAERIRAEAADTEAGLRTAFDMWWREHLKLLAELPATGLPMAAREKLLDTFRTTLGTYPMLDEFALTGLVAEWWGDHLEDIKALTAGGPLRVVQGWAVSVDTMLAPRRVKGGKTKNRSAAERREALAHPLVGRLLPDQLVAVERLAGEHAALDAEIKAAAADEGDETDGLEISAAELAKKKTQRTKVKRALDQLERTFPAMLAQAVADISADRAEEVVLDILHADLLARLDARLEAARRAVVQRYRTLAGKYEISLTQLERRRDTATARLATYLDELGYPRRDTPGMS